MRGLSEAGWGFIVSCDTGGGTVPAFADIAVINPIVTPSAAASLFIGFLLRIDVPSHQRSWMARNR